jgi:hypothetical protein
MGNRSRRALTDGFFRHLFRSQPKLAQQTAPGARFDQAGQNIGRDQFNVGTVAGDLNIGRTKIPPHIERFIYRIDREPQCRVLFDRLSGPDHRDRPICTIALCVEEDLPITLGTTLVEYVQQEVLRARGLRAFLPPKSPLCRPWPDSCSDSDRIWNAIGTAFLDLAALETPQNVRSGIEKGSGSIAFGFEIDIATWDRHAPTLIRWIESLSDCRAHPQSIVMAVVVLSGRGSGTTRLELLHQDLTFRFSDDASVIVLPILGPVTPDEFKIWHRRLMALANDSETEAGLATMMLDVFPDENLPRRMGEIWSPIRKLVREAWSNS